MTAGNVLQQPPYSPSAVTPVPLWSYPDNTLKDCHVRLYSTRPPTPPPKVTDENGNETKVSNETPKKDDVEAALLTEEKKEEKLSIMKRFKLMYKQYWYVLIPVHIITSCVWYGSFFIAAKSGVDIVPMLEWAGASEKILNYLRNNNAGYYAIAYAMYKVASPARYFVTVGGTTISINYLKKYGYIKPVPTKERIQEIYEAVTSRFRALKRRLFKTKNEGLPYYRTNKQKQKGRKICLDTICL